MLALLSSHSAEERRFILRMVEEMSTLLRSHSEGGVREPLRERRDIEALLGDPEAREISGRSGVTAAS